MLRLGRLVYGRLLFAVQILVLAVRLCLKIGFRHIAQQPRQSLIATTSRRSALDCGRRSSPNNRYFFKGVPASPRCRATFENKIFVAGVSSKENFCTFAPRRAQKLFGHIKQHTNLHQYISVSSIYVPYHRIISTNWEGPNVDVIIVQNN